MIFSTGRRAKYILADLASGDVLLMHLGMSGSFRVAEGANSLEPGAFHHPRNDDLTAYPVSPMVNNARNDSPDCIKPVRVS